MKDRIVAGQVAKERIRAWMEVQLEPYRKNGRRKKLHVQGLEEELEREQFKDRITYQEQNGYVLFVQVIREWQQAGKLEPVRSSPYNGRNPAIHTQWWLLPEAATPRWSEMQMLKLSDRLNLTRYRQQPEWQTKEEWTRIEAIYGFLKEKHRHEWVTREERSLQLFGHEKFLAEEGGLLLARLQLGMDDLKARVYGEPFVFWPSPDGEPQAIRTVLIVENLSFYHTCRILMNRRQPIASIRPDLLIYGEGKKIEHSLSFLREFANASHMMLQYAGDMDPEGWGIYVRLKQAYPDYLIRLAVPIYQAMVQCQLTNTTEPGQTRNAVYLDQVMGELAELHHHDLAETIHMCWQEGKRIPQEVLSLDTLR